LLHEIRFVLPLYNDGDAFGHESSSFPRAPSDVMQDEPAGNWGNGLPILDFWLLTNISVFEHNSAWEIAGQPSRVETRNWVGRVFELRRDTRPSPPKLSLTEEKLVYDRDALGSRSAERSNPMEEIWRIKNKNLASKQPDFDFRICKTAKPSDVGDKL